MRAQTDARQLLSEEDLLVGQARRHEDRNLFRPDPAGQFAQAHAGVLDGVVERGVKVLQQLADLDIAREVLDPTKPADAAKSEAAKKWQVYLTDALFKPGDLWRAEFQKRFAILNDRFFDYLCETATQVDARIKIDPNRGTVDKEHGALWYEESVPAESILAGVVWCDRVYPNDCGVTRENLLSTYCKSASLQIGGKATVGKGRVRFVTAVEEGQA